MEQLLLEELDWSAQSLASNANELYILQMISPMLSWPNGTEVLFSTFTKSVKPFQK